MLTFETVTKWHFQEQCNQLVHFPGYNFHTVIVVILCFFIQKNDKDLKVWLNFPNGLDLRHCPSVKSAKLGLMTVM